MGQKVYSGDSEPFSLQDKLSLDSLASNRIQSQQ